MLLSIREVELFAEPVALSREYNVLLLFANRFIDWLIIFTVLEYILTCSWINKLLVLNDVLLIKLIASVTFRDWLELKLVMLLE